MYVKNIFKIMRNSNKIIINNSGLKHLKSIIKTVNFWFKFK